MIFGHSHDIYHPGRGVNHGRNQCIEIKDCATLSCGGRLRRDAGGAAAGGARTLPTQGGSLPPADNEVFFLAVEIDSLTVVELLSSLDDILPFKVTECVVKAGGYGSIEAALTQVAGRIEAKWKKYHAGERL